MENNGNENLINYSMFCNAFYNGDRRAPRLNGCAAQHEVAEFFIRTALGEKADSYLVYSTDTFKSWFAGRREPSVYLWKSVCDNFDFHRFWSELYRTINPASLNDIAEAFEAVSLKGQTVNSKKLCTALSMQFQNIAAGNGTAENIVSSYFDNDTTDRLKHPLDGRWNTYLLRAYNKFSTQKTIFYAISERPFYDFYVCNYIDPAGKNDIYDDYYEPPDNAVMEASLEKLAKYSKHVLLIGTGGIGKTMMMRHLFLQAILCTRSNNGEKAPIFIQLREYTYETGLLSLIFESVLRFNPDFTQEDVNSKLRDGTIQLLMDGVDEIKKEESYFFTLDLLRFTDRFPECQSVISSRDSSFSIELNEFMFMRICPFTESQSLKLVANLNKDLLHGDGQKTAREEIAKMWEEDSHVDFLRIPLLLTMLLITYRRCGTIPDGDAAFYSEYYDTLIYRLDKQKINFRRHFHSAAPEDFTTVFREFCAKSYLEEKTTFNWYSINKIFDELNSVKKIKSSSRKMNVRNFLYDACNIVCVMYEDGGEYYFLHRTFQEYFFADYCSHLNDCEIHRVGNVLANTDHYMYEKNCIAYRMLYEMDEQKVERCIFLPYLHRSMQFAEAETRYFLFLDSFYTKVCCTRLYINNPYARCSTVSSNNDIVEWIFETIGLRSPEDIPYLNILINYDELLDRTEFSEAVGTYLHITDRGYFEEDESAADGVKIIDGYGSLSFPDRSAIKFSDDYEFPFRLAIEKPEKYKEVIDVLTNEDCPLWTQYLTVYDYYMELKSKYGVPQFTDDHDTMGKQ